MTHPRRTRNYSPVEAVNPTSKSSTCMMSHAQDAPDIDTRSDSFYKSLKRGARAYGAKNAREPCKQKHSVAIKPL